MGSRSLTDTEFDVILGRVLRLGVILSALVVLAGASLFLVRHGHELPRYHVFVGEPSDLRSLKGIASDVRALSGRGIIQLGLLMLIATPIARVVFSVFGFARQRDWMYVGITALVLGLLLYSLLTA